MTIAIMETTMMKKTTTTTWAMGGGAYRRKVGVESTWYLAASSLPLGVAAMSTVPICVSPE
jgi:hypothetical protein